MTGGETRTATLTLVWLPCAETWSVIDDWWQGMDRDPCCRDLPNPGDLDLGPQVKWDLDLADTDGQTKEHCFQG